MKFKYIGQLPIKDVDLVLNRVLNPNSTIYNGQIIEIPDSNEALIERIKISGVYEVYTEPKQVNNKFKKKSKKQDEKKED